MLNRFFYLFATFILLLSSCSDNDKELVVPEDADDNFVTSVVMTVDGTSYSATIEDNTITITIPYTISLKNAKVEFKYTSSASIMPNPESITDWDNERIFRVTSYNGEENEYTYRVIKDEIRHEGDADLKTAADVATFAATGTTIVKGNLIIGSDEKNAEALNDISSLSLLKEVTGNIIIRNSYNGADLTGLDNITSIGGLQIGSQSTFSTSENLHMVTMRALQKVSGDVLIRNNNLNFITFNSLPSIEGNLTISSSTIQNIEFPVLANIGKNLNIQGVKKENGEDKSGGTIVILTLPELTTVEGELSVNYLEKLEEISFPKLQSAGSINFATIPVLLEKIELPEITTVNGDLLIEANYVISTGGGGLTTGTANNRMTRLDGLSKLTTVKGLLTISNFQVLAELPDTKNITRLGGIKLNWLEECNGKELNLENANFETFNDVEPSIDVVGYTNLAKITTKEDLSNVNVNIETMGRGANTAIFPELNFKSVKSFSNNNTNANADPVYLFEKVHGNLSISRPMKKGCSAPNLTTINGYLHIKIPMMAQNVEFPKLENIGGQLYAEGNQNTQIFNFPKLKYVCCAENPVYVQEGALKDIPYGSLHMQTTKALIFPELIKIGGTGFTIKSAASVSCPKLTTINGILCVSAATQLTTLDMPLLEQLSGVLLSGLTKFTDFTMFGKFIKNGNITENNWTITKCGYEPSYQDMIDGKYTKE